MKVVKRNGDKVDFDLNKIKIAILKANVEVENGLSGEDVEQIVNNAIFICSQYGDEIHIEQIQDIVEKEITKFNYDVGKAYITYRYKRQLEREKYNNLMHNIECKLMAKDVQNQNANVDENSFGGRVNETSGVILKQFALDYCMNKTSRDNHLNNEVYIHDLDHYALGDHNCLSIPFDNLLENGFSTRQTDVRPAGSVNTAMQLVAVLFQLQSLQQFGGCSATHLDWTMVPYVRKSFAKHYKNGLKYLCDIDAEHIDYEIENMLSNAKDYSIEDEEYKAYSEKAYRYAIDLTEKETHQATEALYHNLNTLQSRSGCQLPFTSINYGTCTLPEGRMVIKELLDVSIEGLGSLHRTSIFPCGIFQCMKGVNRKPGDPNYDLFKLALKSTSQRLYPNFANCDWSGNAGYDKNDPKTYFSTMGCRTSNGFDINGMNQTKDGRGNICPVTIILPTLAMEANRDVEEFMKLLELKIEQAKDTLIERFNYICSKSPKAATFMYENGTMEGYIPEEGIRSALKHGTLAIGQLGLAEALQLLIGKNHTTPEGMELAKRIEQLYKDKCAKYKEEYKLNFGVYFTPAENLCHTAMKKFIEKYGVIEKVSDKEYFTNSMHIPVWEKVGIFEKIDLESQLTGYSSAGCITYVELDATTKNNIEALETIVNYAMDKDVPYFAINVPNDTCLKCGYTDDLGDTCPQCGSDEIERLRRVTGYLSADYHHFNKGKIQEVEQRFKHSKITKEFIK